MLTIHGVDHLCVVLICCLLPGCRCLATHQACFSCFMLLQVLLDGNFVHSLDQMK